MNKGKIIQVIGPVVDVEFSDGLPRIYDALEIVLPLDSAQGKISKLVLETHQHMGGNKVRSVAMGSTDGLKRGMEVVDTGAAISVPVGAGVLGRMFNLLGETIDGIDAKVESERRDPIHRDAPSFAEQSTQAEILETGIKVIDLICPFVKGGKVGLFGGAGVRRLFDFCRSGRENSRRE
ncbi:MAG: F-type H+-transporting ATPase subunit beta [Parcubacteria group bacterium Athens0714_25]|nr:MAG: F-type H+-transporting ATPase subunit beta [Parcubacteria group bacterium Athens0714_25]